MNCFDVPSQRLLYVAVQVLSTDDAIAGADAFITGEMHYHEYFRNQQIQIAVIGHYQSE